MYIDGLVQDCSNSSALAMELLHFYTKPSSFLKLDGLYKSLCSWKFCKDAEQQAVRQTATMPVISYGIHVTWLLWVLSKRWSHLSMRAIDECLRMYVHVYVFHHEVLRWNMMTSSNGNIFRVTGHLCREFTGHRSPHKGQWCGALMFSLICVWINGWVNIHGVGDLRRYRGHYDVNVIK